MKRTRLVLDTNILIYGINEESIYFEEIRNRLESNRYSFFVTTKTVSEFVCVLSKLKRYDVIEKELPVILRREGDRRKINTTHLTHPTHPSLASRVRMRSRRDRISAFS